MTWCTACCSSDETEWTCILDIDPKLGRRTRGRPLAEALELDRLVFMGSSFGGVVCLYLARDYPERFRALVALEAADYTPGYYLDWWRHPEVDSRDLTASVVAGLMAPHPLTNERDRRLTMWYYAQGGPGVLKGDLYFYSVEHDMRETAKDIPGKVPLYMLTGEYDYLSTPEQTHATAAKIRGAKAMTMHRIGHFPMSENHETFMNYLRPVLQEIKQAVAQPTTVAMPGVAPGT